MEIDKTHHINVTFRQLFEDYYEKLHRYAYTVLKDDEAARDAVQSVFTRLWEKKETVTFGENIKSYLYTSTHHHCLNIIRQGNYRQQYRVYRMNVPNSQNDQPESQIMARELQQRIRMATDALPPQCREIFLKSRDDGKKYGEIAAEMKISVKTVEAQMGKALRILREKLQAYIVTIAMILWSILR